MPNLRQKTFFFCRARHFLLVFQKKMWRIPCGKAAAACTATGANTPRRSRRKKLPEVTLWQQKTC